MTGNQMFCRENELDESFKQLASYINIPVGVLLPFKKSMFCETLQQRTNCLLFV